MELRKGQEKGLRLRIAYDLAVKKGLFKKGEGSIIRIGKGGKEERTMWFEREDFKRLVESEEVTKVLNKVKERLAETNLLRIEL